MGRFEDPAWSSQDMHSGKRAHQCPGPRGPIYVVGFCFGPNDIMLSRTIMLNSSQKKTNLNIEQQFKCFINRGNSGENDGVIGSFGG